MNRNFLLAILFCLVLKAYAFPPSAKIIVTEAGVNKLMSTTIPFIVGKIGTLRLPPISFLNVDVTNISIQNMSLDSENANVDLTPGFYTVRGSNLHMQISADFTANYLFFKSKGSVVATAQGTSFTVKNKVDFTDDNRYQLEVTESNVDINNFSLQITGDKLAVFAGKIEKVFNGLVKLAVEKQVEGTLKTIVPYILNTVLLNVPNDLPVLGSQLNVDLTAAQAPVISDGYFEAYSSFYVYRANNKVRPQVPAPAPFPQIGHRNDITMMLSQYFLDSISYSLYQKDSLKFPISHNDVPSSFPFKLTTTSLDALAPGLRNQFGEGKPIDLECYAVASPIFKLESNSITSIFYSACDNFVINEQNRTRAFTLNFTMDMNLTLSLDKNALRANVNEVKISNAALTNTNIRGDPQSLESLLNLIFDAGKSLLDSYVFSHAFPVPQIPHIEFSDALFEFIDGTMILSGSPKFTEN